MTRDSGKGEKESLTANHLVFGTQEQNIGSKSSASSIIRYTYLYHLLFYIILQGCPFIHGQLALRFLDPHKRQ